MNSANRILLVLGLLFLLAIAGFTYYHEQAHVRVYENFGLTNIKVHYGLISTATAEGDCNDICQLASSNVEAFGYNLQGVLIFMFVSVMAIFLMFIEMGAFDE